MMEKLELTIANGVTIFPKHVRELLVGEVIQDESEKKTELIFISADVNAQRALIFAKNKVDVKLLKEQLAEITKKLEVFENDGN